MLNLPTSTEFNKIIPKKKFYENMSISPTLKDKFTSQIKKIYWRNKISSDTVNIEKGKDVEEIEIFEVNLNQQSIDESILKQIDKVIPYQILYVLEFQNQYQLCIAYKEIGINTSNVNSYFYSNWNNINSFEIKLSGLSIDSVYEELVRYIAGDQLNDRNSTLKESIEVKKQKENIQKEINKLQLKLRKEKQFNKQVEINNKIKILRKELNELC